MDSRGYQVEVNSFNRYGAENPILNLRLLLPTALTPATTADTTAKATTNNITATTPGVTNLYAAPRTIQWYKIQEQRR